jgi:hypothetical protein
LTTGMTRYEVESCIGRPLRLLDARRMPYGYEEIVLYRNRYREYFALEYVNNQLVAADYFYDDGYHPMYPERPAAGHPVFPPHYRPDHPYRPEAAPRPGRTPPPAPAQRPPSTNRPPSAPPRSTAEPPATSRDNERSRPPSTERSSAPDTGKTTRGGTTRGR